ncbi:hypothetical protein KA005_70975 [bacterium]|nr:hypothetical protein [bacterium]
MKHIAKLALQIIGIYSIVSAIPLISAFINSLGFPVEGPVARLTIMISSIIPFILLIATGCYLISKAKSISEIIISNEDKIDSNITIKSIDLQAIAFSIVGVILMVLTIPKLFQLGVNIYALQKTADKFGAEPRLARDTISFGVSLLIQFILGVLLFFSGNSIANLWHKFVHRIQYEKNITNR